MEHPTKFRFLAGLLAAGGVLWGLLASAVMFRTLASLVFIPGYFVTAGYFVRCIYTPRLSWRRMIWGSSAFVQGAWLFIVTVFLVCPAFHEGHITADDIPFIPLVWWIAAFSISIYGFLYDKRAA